MKDKLSKREYFAAMILQGFIINDRMVKQAGKTSVDMAVHYADELIRALAWKELECPNCKKMSKINPEDENKYVFGGCQHCGHTIWKEKEIRRECPNCKKMSRINPENKDGIILDYCEHCKHPIWEEK